MVSRSKIVQQKRLEFASPLDSLTIEDVQVHEL